MNERKKVQENKKLRPTTNTAKLFYPKFCFVNLTPLIAPKQRIVIFYDFANVHCTVFEFYGL